MISFHHHMFSSFCGNSFYTQIHSVILCSMCRESVRDTHYDKPCRMHTYFIKPILNRGRQRRVPYRSPAMQDTGVSRSQMRGSGRDSVGARPLISPNVVATQPSRFTPKVTHEPTFFLVIFVSNSLKHHSFPCINIKYLKSLPASKASPLHKCTANFGTVMPRIIFLTRIY